MNRQTKQGDRIRPWMTLALLAGLAGCSAAPSPTWSGGGSSASDNTGGGGNNASSGSGGSSGSSSSGGGHASGSSSSGGGGGSSGTGGSSGAKSGGSSGSGSGAASSGSVSSNGIPTAEGFTSGPAGATDLAAPPAADGIQFETPTGAYTVMPGQEIFPNFCVTVPNNIQVGGFQSWMSSGSSHHFILYKGGTASGSTCAPGTSWLYASSTPGQVITDNMPANVGLSLPANTQLILNMHFINPGSASIQPKIKINLLFAKNVMYQAGTMISFNTSINVPAASSSGPGTQTVSGTCSAPAGSKFFSMSTHTHKHATAALVNYIHNGQTTEIVHTGPTSTYPADQEQGSGTDWEHPGVGLWTTPNFLTVQSGDSFTYSCSYSNTGTAAVTVGETASANEMCMAIGYYFPVSTSALCR